MAKVKSAVESNSKTPFLSPRPQCFSLQTKYKIFIQIFALSLKLFFYAVTLQASCTDKFLDHQKILKSD